MKLQIRLQNILCMILILLLAIPQYVSISAEEESEPDEAFLSEHSNEETTENTDEDTAIGTSEYEIEDNVSIEEEQESSISLSQTYIELHPGDHFQFETIIDGIEDTEIIWDTNAPEVILLDQKGTVTALEEGTAEVTVSLSDNKVLATAIVKVLATPSSYIRFEKNSYELEVGDTITIPYISDANQIEDVIWTIEDESVAKINTEKDGEIDIEALSSGVVQIKGQTNDIESTLSLVVLEQEDPKYASIRALNNSKAATVTASYSLTYDQSGARELGTKLNAYRQQNAQLFGLNYDYTIEKYAMQRAAEIVLSFSHTRPDGSAWHTVFDKSKYGTESTTNLNENILCTGDGSMSTALQVLNRVLSDNTQRSRSLRGKNKSFGIAHAVYNGIDYWVMLFSDSPSLNQSQTSPVNKSQSVSIKIASNLYSSPNFTAGKSLLKVNVGKSIGLPSVNGTINVILGGKQKSIAFSGYSVTWTLDSTGKKYASISNGKVVAKNEPNNTENAYLIATANMNGSLYSVKVQLKVVQPVTGVRVTPSEGKIDLGKTIALTAIVSPENASDKSVTWKSSDTKVATVNAKGIVTGKKGGTCTISAVTNDGGYKAASTITVIVHASNIAFEVGELTMTVDMADKLVPVFTPADTTDKRVIFVSSDSSKISVKSDGTIQALEKTGSDPVIITMTAVDGLLSAELPVIVKDKDRVAKPGASYLFESSFEVTAFDYNELGFAEMLTKGDPIKLHCDTKDAVIYYTLDGSDPDHNSQKYTGMIPYEGGNLTVKAIAVKMPQMKDSEIAEFRFEETDESTWEIAQEDLDKLVGDDGLYHIPAGLWAAGVDETTVYTGNKITFPNIRVYYHNHMLMINDEYSISYKNNINVCPEETAGCTITYNEDGSFTPKNTKISYITITGKGSFKGSTYIPFRIVPITISEENGFVSQNELYETLGNKPLNPLPTILWNGKKLKNKTDYVISYSKDPQGTQIIEGGIKTSDLPDSVNFADFYAIISGVKNFTSAENKFSVPIHVKKNAVQLNKVQIKINNIEYTGDSIDPDDLAMTVSFGKETLVKGNDYIIENTSPEEIKEIGIYTIAIKATDNSKYIGEKTTTFKVVGKPLSKTKVYCLGNQVSYTGNTFTINDLYKADPKRPDLSSITLYYENEKLTEGKDYTIQISGQNKGKGTISFIGMGSYTGTIKKSFTINPKPITKDELFIYTTDMSFSKTGARPFVYVFLKTDPDDPSGYEISEGLYGKYLVEKEDYTLKFLNNKKIYTDDSFQTKNAPSVTVTMKGNYKGTIANNYFLILSEDISYMRIESDDILYNASKKGPQYFAKPVIYDYEGKKLTLNKDYELTYYYAQDAKVNGSLTYNRSYGSAIRATDIPEPGTVISVKATGIGSYYGELTSEYKVFKKGMNLSAVRVKIDYLNGKNQYFEYTGAQIIPAAKNLQITMGKETLTYGVDYEILSVSNNIKAGKATMVLHGLGEFAGTKKVTFNIGKQTLFLSIKNLIRSILGV